MSHVPLRNINGETVIDSRDNSSDIIEFETSWDDLPLNPATTETPPSPFGFFGPPPVTGNFAFSRTATNELQVDHQSAAGDILLAAGANPAVDMSTLENIRIRCRVKWPSIISVGASISVILGLRDDAFGTGFLVVALSGVSDDGAGNARLLDDQTSVKTLNESTSATVQAPSVNATGGFIDIATHNGFFTYEMQITSVSKDNLFIRVFVDGLVYSQMVVAKSSFNSNIFYPYIQFTTSDATSRSVIVDNIEVSIVRTYGGTLFAPVTSRAVLNSALLTDITTGVNGQRLIDGTGAKYVFNSGVGWASDSHLDVNAIHDNVAGEITAIIEKVTPVSADLIIIEDSAAGNAKKKVQVSNLPGNGKVLVSATDTTSDYLSNSLIEGGGVSLIVDNPGADETISIYANTPYTAVVGTDPTDDFLTIEAAIAALHTSILVKSSTETVDIANIPDVTLYLEGALYITDRSYTMPTVTVRIVGLTSFAVVYIGSTAGGLTHFTGTGFFEVHNCRVSDISGTANNSITSVESQKYKNIGIEGNAGATNIIKAVANGTLIIDGCIVDIPAAEFINVTTGRETLLDNILIKQLSTGFTWSSPNIIANNILLSDADNDVLTFTLAGKINNFVNKNQSQDTVIFSNDIQCSNCDFGWAAPTWGNNGSFSNCKYDNLNTLFTENIIGNHNSFTNFIFGVTALKNVNISGSFNTFFGCTVGDQVGGGANRTFDVATATGTTLVGCKTDVAIIDTGTGTYVAGNQVY